MEAFGDSVVPAEAPHGGDFLFAAIQSLAELNQLREARLPQLVHGIEELGYEGNTLFAGTVPP